MAYTYQISWTKFNKHYIGAQWKVGAKPSDLFVKYFTSSKLVKEFIKEHGLPDIVKTQSFLLAEDAIKAERDLILNNNALDDERFFNQSVNMGTHIKIARNLNFSEEVRRKFSEVKVKYDYDLIMLSYMYLGSINKVARAIGCSKATVAVVTRSVRGNMVKSGKKKTYPRNRKTRIPTLEHKERTSKSMREYHKSKRAL